MVIWKVFLFFYLDLIDLKMETVNISKLIGNNTANLLYKNGYTI